MNNDKSSYKDIIKSSGLIAYVQVFQMFFGLLRNKAIALILGASGFGIWGLYNTFMEMVTAFSCLGLDRSGVREIAKSQDIENTQRCIWIFKRLIFSMAVFLSIVIVLLSKHISVFLFNSPDYRYGIMVMALVILCRSLNSSFYSILNGLRFLKELAKSQIYATVAGSILAVIIIIILRERAITLALFAIAGCMAFYSYYFVRKLKITTKRPSLTEAIPIIRSLYSLGLGFCVSSIISTILIGKSSSTSYTYYLISPQ